MTLKDRVMTRFVGARCLKCERGWRVIDVHTKRPLTRDFYPTAAQAWEAAEYQTRNELP